MGGLFKPGQIRCSIRCSTGCSNRAFTLPPKGGREEKEGDVEHREVFNGSLDLPAVLEQIKQLEAQGFTFEGAEASVELMLRRTHPAYVPPFELSDYTVNVQRRRGRGLIVEATVKVRVGPQIMHTVAEGNGPVNALDAALRKALIDIFPQIAGVRLEDYKVRILDGENNTAATTRVLIETRQGARRWSTVGASANIIDASWRALADSMEYALVTS